MRKYVIGALVGAALVFGVQAGAAGILNKGDKVAGIVAVDINGKDIGNGAIINDTTYLPARIIAESFGATATPKKGRVSLTTAATPEPTPSSGPATTPSPTPDPSISYTLSDVEARIQSLNQQIATWQAAVDRAEAKGIPDDPDAVTARQAIQTLKDQLATWQQRKAELEAKK